MNRIIVAAILGMGCVLFLCSAYLLMFSVAMGTFPLPRITPIDVSEAKQEAVWYFVYGILCFAASHILPKYLSVPTAKESLSNA